MNGPQLIGDAKAWAHRQLNSPPHRVEADGLVTWNTYGWGAGESPAEVSAINYWIVADLRRALDARQVDRAVEIGAGYGRVTPWLSLFADSVTAVEPNDEMRANIEAHYPQVETVAEKAQDLPLETSSCDLLVMRSVLQHVPRAEFETVCAELERVRSPAGVTVLMEDVKGEESSTHHPRPEREYAAAFESWGLVGSWPRETPGFEYSVPGLKQVMVFE